MSLKLSRQNMNRLREATHVHPKSFETLMNNAKKEIKRAENMRKLVHGETYKNKFNNALKKAKSAYNSTLKKLNSIEPVIYLH